MKMLSVKPAIHKCATAKEFIDEFKLGKGDLVITSEDTYKKFFAPYDLDCHVIYRRKYGAGEPSDDMVEAIYADCPKDYKRVIAIGGGSVLDVSKFFALKHVSPVLDLYDGKLPVEKDKELILVPTTCGTGSEVTNISILALNSRGTKKGLATDAMYADTAVLIPELLEVLPFRVFATSSIDALIHAVESSLSPKANELTKMYGYKAIDMILRGYKKVVAGGPEALKPLLEDFLMASTYAGIAFGNAGCAAVHALSYPLGGTYHVAHGEANYAMFTGVMNNYMEMKQDGEIAVLNQYIANILECDVKDVYPELEKLLNNLVPKKALHEYGMTEAEIDAFTDSVVANQQRLLGNNFVPFDRDRIYKVYKELY